MPFHRFQIDLAIPLDDQDELPPVFYKKLNEVLTLHELQALANMKLIEVIKRMIRKLREYSVKVNKGRDDEENTVRTRMHKCRHDVGQSCDQEEDI